MEQPWPFRPPQNFKLLGAATSIDFSAATPAQADFCVCAGARLSIFDGLTSACKRTLTRFKDKVYSGSFRPDGRLIVAGGEDTLVQVFDSSSRTLLRQLKGHTAAVHAARFAADQVHVISGGDDGRVLLWDITSGQQVSTLTGHSDYVRGVASNPASTDVWATSSYDHVCKLWDVRQKRCLASMDHGAPIESVAFFPSGSMLVTAGGTDLCIWHMLGQGQLVQRVTAHQKTVTSVVVAAVAGQEPHVLSAGLDGHIKGISAETYKPVTLHKFLSPILSLGVSPAANVLAAGLADGTVSVHRRKQAVAAAEPTRLRWRPQRAVGARQHFAAPSGRSVGPQKDDSVAPAQGRAGVSRHEELLLKFRFTEALEVALATQRWEVVDNVVQSLVQHGALEATLAVASPELVASILQHVRRQLGRPGAERHAVALAECLLCSCPSVVAGEVQAVTRLRAALAEELRTQEELTVVQGMLDALVGSS